MWDREATTEDTRSCFWGLVFVVVKVFVCELAKEGYVKNN